MNEILIGYVRSFSYNIPAVKDALAPHPIQGGIYRIIKTTNDVADEPVFQLYLGKKTNKAKMDSILLGNTLNGTYEGKWDFEIDIVDESNYLGYEFDSKSLTKLKKWLDTDNADIRGIIEKLPHPNDIISGSTPATPAPQDVTPEEMANLSEKLIKVKDRFAEFDMQMRALQGGINVLIQRDMGVIGPIAAVVNKMANAEGWFESRPDIAKQMLLTSKSHEIGTTWAIANIQNYILNDGAEPDFIVMAIINLIYELQRANLQNDKPNE